MPTAQEVKDLDREWIFILRSLRQWCSPKRSPSFVTITAYRFRPFSCTHLTNPSRENMAFLPPPARLAGRGPLIFPIIIP